MKVPADQNSVRLNVSLTPKSAGRLAFLRGVLGATSNVDVIRRALSLLALLAEEVQAGGHVHLIRKSGETLLLDALVVTE